MPPKAGPKSANLTETEKMLLSVLKMSDTKAVSWDKVHKFMGTESTIGAIKQRYYKLMALVPADIVAAGTTSGGEGENGIEQAKPATKKRSGGEGEDQIEKAKPATKKRKAATPKKAKVVKAQKGENDSAEADGDAALMKSKVVKAQKVEDDSAEADGDKA